MSAYPRLSEMTAADAVDAAFARIAADGREGIWIELVDRAGALESARLVDERVAAGESLPLAGRTLAVKGNIDVAGIPTTAACPTFASGPAAANAPVVQALIDAGAVVVGVTNLDQFATGLVGTRSPYGICPNAHWPGLISGGSSSGSAVAVAAGHVDLSLGTDTAGSGRIPAGANGIVGLKPTRGALSTTGVVPACRSIDCVSVFAATVDDAAEAAAVAAVFDPADPWSRQAPESVSRPHGTLRIGMPRAGDLVLTDPVSPTMFTELVAGVAIDASAQVVTVDIGPFVDAGALLYEGAFVAERYAAVGAFVDAHLDEVDPVVGAIISASGRLPAWRLAADYTRLAELRRYTEPVWDEIDVLIVPTASGIPTIAEVLADPVGVNTELGRYTNFVNLLDLCALTLPVGPPLVGHPPASLTLIAPAWADDLLVTIGRRATSGNPATRRTR